ncbi:MAG: 2-oxo acid dehydrogenase subunit E2, partial [Anaerolineae bacterium]|nr:2-oxo acid dehydrogenase subunit E2 [Anaerolineae bacterium]
NTVESCVLIEWKKAVGDAVAEGDVLCDAETDKAVVEVTSPADGVLLAQFHAAGDLVPVLETIAAIGQPGEDVSALRPGQTVEEAAPDAASEPAAVDTTPAAPAVTNGAASTGRIAISPRARNLAQREGLDFSQVTGSGPEGRIIERDIQAALAARPKLSPVAQAKLAQGGYVAPEKGSGPRGRVMTRDLQPLGEEKGESTERKETREIVADEVEVVKVTGVRKVIAERMLASLQTTAQLTLNASADARALQALRARFKASGESFGLQAVTINDLVLLAVARTLPQHPILNAHFQGDTVSRYRHVQLGMAVDTPHGLMVPVIRNADELSLRQISTEAKRLAAACQERRVAPDELTGGTFTMTNLGGLGIESFTPVLNPPEVAILGVNNINLKPVQDGDDVAFVPHIGLSLTINHQVVDGAPGARFLQDLAKNLANIDLLLAV